MEALQSRKRTEQAGQVRKEAVGKLGRRGEDDKDKKVK